MLHRLSIKNYVLVDTLELYFDAGLSVITGETGAGKSVMIGALGLILGQRADLRAIKAGAERCVLEAEFTDIDRLRGFFEAHDLDYDPTSCIIRRELSANGKSRAFVNDTPIALGDLKDLGQQLVDIHSQHQNLWLSKDSFQLNVLDTIAKSEPMLERYRECFNAYEKALKEAKRLAEDLQRQKDEQDYLQFQYRQLLDAKLIAGEQEELEAQRDTLEHAEDIQNDLQQLQSCLGDERGVCAQLKQALSTATHLQRHFPAIEDSCARMNSCLVELKDIERDIEKWNAECELDPRDMDRIESRLNLLYELQQKHHCAKADELIPLRDKLAGQLNRIEQSDELLSQAQAKADGYWKDAQKTAQELRRQRRSVLKSIEDYMIQQLQQLGMPHAKFQILMEDKDLDLSGGDKVTFLFSANRNVAVQSITQIASGGEISRLMLALKSLMAELSSCSCLLFDEIDTGVSGEIAHKMGLLMQNIARHRQVLCITHLPQIAAKGSHHYKVYKSEDADQTISNAVLLSDEERLLEIAKMLSGEEVTQAALDNARLLLGTK